MLTEFYGQALISPRTSHGSSRTFTDEFGFPHEHLTDAHGVPRKILDFSTGTSRKFTDFKGRIFISSQTPYEYSRAFTDEF